MMAFFCLLDTARHRELLQSHNHRNYYYHYHVLRPSFYYYYYHKAPALASG